MYLGTVGVLLIDFENNLKDYRHGWTNDEILCPFQHVFQSYQDDVKVVMKACMQ